MVDRCMTPMEALRNSTVVSARLIDLTDHDLDEPKPITWPTSSPWPATPPRHKSEEGRPVRDTGRLRLQWGLTVLKPVAGRNR